MVLAYGCHFDTIEQCTVFRFGQLHFHLDVLSHLQVKLSSVVNNKSHNKLFCELVVCTLSKVVCFAIFMKWQHENKYKIECTM